MPAGLRVQGFGIRVLGLGFEVFFFFKKKKGFEV